LPPSQPTKKVQPALNQGREGEPLLSHVLGEERKGTAPPSA
jgi:hypothetical protein